MNVCLCILLFLFSFSRSVSAIVKVVLFGGQSNCQGLADNSHLKDLIKGNLTAAQYIKYAADGNNNNIATRSDVYVIYEPERGGISGPLTTGYGDSRRNFGTEMGLGWVLGDYFVNDNDPLLIVKHCEVLPLAVEWKSPSSSTNGARAGDAYTRAIKTYSNALDNLGQYIPNYDGLGYNIISFVWMHGYADMYEPSYLAQYETNLVNLIQDIEVQFPKIQSTIIVQSGGGGENPDIAEATMRDIQACAVAAAKSREETTTTTSNNTQTQTTLVETYLFSGGEPRNDETYLHYYGRADNYISIGEAIGNTIIDLLNGTHNASENNIVCPTTTTTSPNPNTTTIRPSATTTVFSPPTMSSATSTTMFSTVPPSSSPPMMLSSPYPSILSPDPNIISATTTIPSSTLPPTTPLSNNNLPPTLSEMSSSTTSPTIMQQQVSPTTDPPSLSQLESTTTNDSSILSLVLVLGLCLVGGLIVGLLLGLYVGCPSVCSFPTSSPDPNLSLDSESSSSNSNSP